MTPLVFLDTETTSLRPDREVWEVAMIRRDDDGERETSFFIGDVDLSNADPFSLRMGGFYDRHPVHGRSPWIHDNWMYRADSPGATVTTGARAAYRVERFTRGAHLVGCVPDFDAGCLDPLLRRHGLMPAWHHHLVDVETLAVGWLHGIEFGGGVSDPPNPPWRSDDLSRLCGVEPPGEKERHTALGDARWVARWYDKITGRTDG